MKTILLLPVLLLLANLSYSQDNDSLKSYSVYYPNANFKPIADGQIPYIIGSSVVPGYDIEIRTCPADENVTLSNGRKIAGLSCILLEKTDYIGGNLISGKDTTVITNVVITPTEDGAIFAVTGEKFSMDFTLSTGTILKLEDNYTVFNTDGKGIWSIVKKEA
jgi:hypothetical protein